MPSTLAAAINASASALAAERTRVEVAVSNIANAESTRGPDGGPYRRRQVVLAPDASSGFDGALGQAIGVRVADIRQDDSRFEMRYEPTHPDADEDGWVRIPNIDTSEEMVDVIGASRAYQANLAAINIIRDMIQRALELART
ncbi:MAG: flagellar basal body rod protein FlgC [Acidobacteriota bacterium]